MNSPLQQINMMAPADLLALILKNQYVMMNALREAARLDTSTAPRLDTQMNKTQMALIAMGLPDPVRG